MGHLCESGKGGLPDLLSRIECNAPALEKAVQPSSHGQVVLPSGLDILQVPFEGGALSMQWSPLGHEPFQRHSRCWN